MPSSSSGSSVPPAQPAGTRDGGRGQIAPVLLSGLVFPGLGQLVTGHPWRALGFGAGSVAILVVVVRRVMSEAERLLPQDQFALLDPALPFTMAAEIQRANAGFFLAATIGLVALWIGSMLDAWLADRRKGR